MSQITNDIETKSLFKKIKKKFSVWASNSTFHGLPNIARSKNYVITIIWTLCLIISSCYCLYEIISVIKIYLNYPVIVDVQLVHESPTYFPAITICNLNQFNNKRSKNFIDQIINSYNLTNKNLNSIKYTQELNELLKREIKHLNLNESTLKLLGYTIDEMLISCSFNHLKCDVNDFEWFYDYNLGNCYIYNNKPSLLKSINKGGINHGLQLEFYVGNVNSSAYVTKTGIQVTIHNQSLLPDLDDGLYIPTGFETNLLIDRLFTYKLDSPYSNCVKNVNGKSTLISKLYRDALINSRSSSLGEYNQKYCIKLCYQNYIEIECKCSVASLPKINNEFEICYNSSELECLNKNRDSFYNSHVYEICDRYCPTECDHVKYVTTTSAANYPTIWYTNLLRQQLNMLNESYYYIKESTLKVNIFYDDLVFTTSIEVPAVRIEDELANIGGHLGLFLGMSVLSIVELFELFFEFANEIKMHFKKQNKIQNMKL